MRKPAITRRRLLTAAPLLTAPLLPACLPVGRGPGGRSPARSPTDTTLRELEPAQLRARALASATAGETPALVVATVHHGEIAVEHAGLASIAEGRPVTDDSAFVWFSITKLFTATAIMQLHERSRLDIDAPVSDLLGSEFPIREPRSRSITARDLLSHSGGLGNPSVWSWAHPAGWQRPPLAELLAQLMAEHGKNPRYLPGAGQHYSNLGYLTLGRMVELAGGRDYETWVREEILEVLGMTRTGFRWTDDMLADWAVGHSIQGGFYTKMAKRLANPEVFGAPIDGWETTVPFEIDGAPYGGLIGTAGDLAKFLGAHLGYGSWQGRRILAPATVDAMREPMRDSMGRRIDHALGWHNDTIQGERYYNHMGKGGGYRPAVRIWPGRGYGVVVLTNRTRYDPRPLTSIVPPR